MKNAILTALIISLSGVQLMASAAYTVEQNGQITRENFASGWNNKRIESQFSSNPEIAYPNEVSVGFGKKPQNNIRFHRFNMRFGFGYNIADSSMNGLPAILKNIRSSWQVKTDFLYKPGAQKNALNDIRKGHGFGVFMTYGRQSAANAGRVLGETNPVNTSKPSRGFLEIETGMMLREEFRISGGAGFMNYYQVSEIQQERASKAYYCFTAGVSPRLLPFLELDLNLGGVVINGDVKPRASVSAVLLLKAK